MKRSNFYPRNAGNGVLQVYKNSDNFDYLDYIDSKHVIRKNSMPRPWAITMRGETSSSASKPSKYRTNSPLMKTSKYDYKLREECR